MGRQLPRRPTASDNQRVASLDDVAALALALPETSERPMHGQRSWRVRDKLFVWERPLRKRDLEEVGPQGLVLGARVEHLVAKRALLESEPEVCFTTSHFEGHASVLVRLERVGAELLEEIVTEAWLVRAPTRLAEEWLRGHRLGAEPL